MTSEHEGYDSRSLKRAISRADATTKLTCGRSGHLTAARRRTAFGDCLGCSRL
jgi:hypothetical protein